ncbi:helix-turn-helix domain-containing protein [Silvibacterium acidisoli]|uniref:helix-turn-helix domain-containing protein n=1 Tax=Acidobacteriaceae bacterium ZG23-2 TaxID=2883246 RepID=UPI00406C7709
MFDAEAREAWEEQVENAIVAAGIGGKIRRLRLKRSMGLVDLGRRTGLSASFLSQLETGRVVPTLRNLSRIALVFERNLDYFFETANRNCFRISRGKVRSRLTINNRSGSMISESMSALIPDRSLVPCIAEFPVSDADSSFFPEIFDGEEFAYVMEGSVVFISASREEILAPGDVLWAQGGAEREYRCKAGESVKVMILTCPQAGGRRVLPRREAKGL